MVKWKLVYTTPKRCQKTHCCNLKSKAVQILTILEQNPYATPPPFDKLVGDLSGVYSRRINIQHRIVYQVLDDKKIIKIIRMFTHYE